MHRKILITGSAGFIGFHLCKKLIQKNEYVIGLDNINSYYDQNLKKSRLNELSKLNKENNTNWFFIEGDLIDNKLLDDIFKKYEPSIVIHLAAQAGVRYSITNPDAYVKSNLTGFMNILETCRRYKVENFLYASSSSVYGGNTKTPFRENDSVDHPVSLYAATKRSNELIAHSYSHLYNLPSTGIRFFTVYGPWGRPDMAPMIFAKSIFEGVPLRIFNNGDMMRDFTYVGDVVDVLIKLIEKPAVANKKFNTNKPEPSSSWAPHRNFNIGNQDPIPLMDFVKSLEKEIGIKAKKTYEGFQQGDVKSTYASINSLQEWIGYKPYTSIKNGIKDFVEWYRIYYNFT